MPCNLFLKAGHCVVKVQRTRARAAACVLTYRPAWSAAVRFARLQALWPVSTSVDR